MDKITCGFDYKLEINYFGQYKFRAKSIHYYWMKEMVYGGIIFLLNYFAFTDYNGTMRSPVTYLNTTMFTNDTFGN